MVCTRFLGQKPHGGSRLVVDFKGINKFIKRSPHPFPSPRDVIRGIRSDSKIFLTFDCVSGYYQIPLAPEDCHYATFMLPEGMYRFCRAPMGLNSANDAFCIRTDESFRSVPSFIKVVDDGLLQGKTNEELFKKFRTILECCRRDNITISRKKLVYGTRVQFAGYIVKVKPNPKKQQALTDFPAPTNVKQLRSFLHLAITNQNRVKNAW